MDESYLNARGELTKEGLNLGRKQINVKTGLVIEKAGLLYCVKEKKEPFTIYYLGKSLKFARKVWMGTSK